MEDSTFNFTVPCCFFQGVFDISSKISAQSEADGQAVTSVDVSDIISDADIPWGVDAKCPSSSRAHPRLIRTDF